MGTPVPNLKIERIAPVNNEVNTYTLTPEELAKYGPVAYRKTEDNRFHARVIQAIKVSDSPERAAELLGTSVGKLKQYLGSREIYPNWAKKDGDDMRTAAHNGSVSKRFEMLKTGLSKEEYISNKNAGLSDRLILKTLGFDRHSYTNALTKLKKEWGLDGFSLKKPQETPFYPGEKAAELKAAEAIGAFLSNVGSIISPTFIPPIDAAESIGVFLGRLGSALTYDTAKVLGPDFDTSELKTEASQAKAEDTEDDEVIWATSHRPINQDATIRVHEKGASLNSHALREMAGIKTVNVGVTKKGIIVVQRGVGPGTYVIGRTDSPESKGSSAKIGGGSLGKFLASHGIKPGKYFLVRNETKDRWEADVNA